MNRTARTKPRLMRTYCAAVLLLAGLLLSTACSAAGVVWLDADNSLWKTMVSPVGKPIKLFGDVMSALVFAVSPDGHYVATDGDSSAHMAIYDVTKPGARRTLGLRPGDYWFTGAWAPGGKGILVSKIVTTDDNQDGVQVGVFEARPDGYLLKVAPPAAKNQPWCYDGKLSPNGRMLALEGGGLQVVELSPRPRTLLYRPDLELDSAARLVWADDRHVLAASTTGLLLIDVEKRTISHGPKYGHITSMVYSRSLKRAYVVMGMSEKGEILYCIDPSNWRCLPVHAVGSDRIWSIQDVSADGKTALVLARERAGDKAGLSLWLLDLSSGEHTVITRNAVCARLLP